MTVNPSPWIVVIEWKENLDRYYIYAADKRTRTMRHPISAIPAEAQTEEVAKRKARTLQKSLLRNGNAVMKMRKLL